VSVGFDTQNQPWLTADPRIPTSAALAAGLPRRLTGLPPRPIPAENGGVLKAAALCSALLGLGFGIPCAIGLAHFARQHEVWMLWGLPTYGHGPFDSWGLPTSVPLLLGYLVVCVAEVVLAAALWVGAPHVAAYSLALLPVEAVFWVGFALPFGPPLGIARVLLAFLA
jgi:hypothetical protein